MRLQSLIANEDFGLALVPFRCVSSAEFSVLGTFRSSFSAERTGSLPQTLPGSGNHRGARASISFDLLRQLLALFPSQPGLAKPYARPDPRVPATARLNRGQTYRAQSRQRQYPLRNAPGLRPAAGQGEPCPLTGRPIPTSVLDRDPRVPP